MDGGTTVPLAWLVAAVVGLGGALIAGFLWWIRSELSRLGKQQEQLVGDIRGIHRRIDFLIEKRYGRTYDAMQAEHSQELRRAIG